MRRAGAVDLVALGQAVAFTAGLALVGAGLVLYVGVPVGVVIFAGAVAYFVVPHMMIEIDEANRRGQIAWLCLACFSHMHYRRWSFGWECDGCGAFAHHELILRDYHELESAPELRGRCWMSGWQPFERRRDDGALLFLDAEQAADEREAWSVAA